MNGDAAEAAWIDEANFAVIGQGEDSVSVRCERDFGRGDEQATSHAEVDEEFGGGFVALHGHDDGFADSADGLNARAGEGGCDLGFGGLEGLRFAAGPDADDARSVDAGVDASGDGFDFGKLGHKVQE